MSPPGRLDLAQPTYKQRDIAELRRIVGMLANFIWTKRLRPGEHLWSIPADPERDFDCLLSDAIDELEALRSAVSGIPLVVTPQEPTKENATVASPPGTDVI